MLDAPLRRWLDSYVPDELRPSLVADLERWHGRCVTECAALAADAEKNEPAHIPFDAHKRRFDQLVVADGWLGLGRVAAEEGLASMPHEDGHDAWSRVRQACKLIMFHPHSAIYDCPVAMTDGAIRVLIESAGAEVQEEALPRLLSREGDLAWSSGQWMTEERGGSDVVGSTRTVARPTDKPDVFALHGTKWFTSATTADTALTLARIEGEEGLSCFYVRVRRDASGWDGIEVRRLKDKLGTRALPTAELDLVGVRGILVGPRGRGIKTLAPLLNITRFHNALAAVGAIGEGVRRAREYATERVAFGKPLAEHPLHDETLRGMEQSYVVCLHLAMRVAMLLGRDDAGIATDDERAELRLLTPLVKLYTGKVAATVTQEAMECFGGNGYVEDLGMARLFRDANVLPIWEGTTNVLTLDALRSIDKDGTLAPFLAACRARCDDARIHRDLEKIQQLYQTLRAEGRPALERQARRLAWALARMAAASLLAEAQENDALEGLLQEGFQGPRIE